MTQAAISARDVSKRFRLYHERPQSLKEAVVHRRRARYDELWALRNVSLEVARGTTYGLIGHNGSGKSTLLKLLAGIHQPTSGSVTARGRVGALLELGAGFHPELTGRENVYLNGSIMGLSRKEIRRAFDDIVSFSGLEQFIDSPVKIYSSGMYVRLGFSVAVNLRPDILLIDEIIAVGDEEFQRRCMDHIYKLRQEGCTIMLVSHSIATIENLCDHAAWLDHGEVLEQGATASVTARYLDHVNTAERARLDSTETPSVSGRRKPGDKEVEIIGLEFLDADGQETSSGSTGDPLTIRMRYRAHAPVEEPAFLFGFHHESGVHIAEPNSKREGLRSGVLTGEGAVEYAFERLALMPGLYLVSASIWDSQQLHPYDFNEKGWLLHVQPGSGRQVNGLVETFGRWEHAERSGRRPGSAAVTGG